MHSCLCCSTLAVNVWSRSSYFSIWDDTEKLVFLHRCKRVGRVQAPSHPPRSDWDDSVKRHVSFESSWCNSSNAIILCWEGACRWDSFNYPTQTFGIFLGRVGRWKNYESFSTGIVYKSCRWMNSCNRRRIEVDLSSYSAFWLDSCTIDGAGVSNVHTSILYLDHEGVFKWLPVRRSSTWTEVWLWKNNLTNWRHACLKSRVAVGTTDYCSRCIQWVPPFNPLGTHPD